MSRNPYQPKIARRWYLSTPAFRAYTIREASSLFIGLWYINLAYGITRLVKGEAAWDNWLVFQTNPLMLLFSIVTLVLALYHSTTWFSMTPRVMPPRIAGMKVNQLLMKMAHWVGLVGVTILVFVAVTWGIS